MMPKSNLTEYLNLKEFHGNLSINAFQKKCICYVITYELNSYNALKFVLNSVGVLKK